MPGFTPAYRLAGPSSGPVGSPVTFGVTPNSTVVSDTVTLSDGGAGGTFHPTSLTWTNSSASMHFTYTAAAAGTVSISATSAALTLVLGSPLTYIASRFPPTRNPGGSLKWYPGLRRPLRKARP